MTAKLFMHIHVCLSARCPGPKTNDSDTGLMKWRIHYKHESLHERAAGSDVYVGYLETDSVWGGEIMTRAADLGDLASMF